MTARRNEPWGSDGPLPPEAPLFDSDAALSEWYSGHALVPREPQAVGLVGGDLHRTLGGRGDRERPFGPNATRVQIDVIEVALDHGDFVHHAVAHVVARRSWLFGPLTFVMNADFVGDWNVAPRAHPGDGRLDIVRADLGFGDRLKAWRRLPAGTHVPHPGIAQRRATDIEVEFGRPLRVDADGRQLGRARVLEARVVPDALTVVI